MKHFRKIFHIVVLSLILYAPLQFAAAKNYSTDEIVAMAKAADVKITNNMLKVVRDHQLETLDDINQTVTSDFFGIIFEPGGDMLSKDQYLSVVNSTFLNGFSDVKRLITHIQVYGSVVVEQGLIVIYVNYLGTNVPAVVFTTMETLLIQDDGTLKYNTGIAQKVAIDAALQGRISNYIAHPELLYKVVVSYDKIK